MGRGGGSASSGGGDIDIPDNPIVRGVMFCIGAVVFAVLTIAVPIYLVFGADGKYCVDAKSLNLKEQMVCLPPQDELDETYETDPQYPKDVKVYYIKSADWSSVGLTTRTHTYKPYTTELNEEYDDFTICSSYSAALDLQLTCTGSRCSRVKVYWLTHEQFQRSLDSHGTFIEPSTGLVHDGFSSGVPYYTTSPLTTKTGSFYYHLIFSNHKESDVRVTYTANLTYTVYDMSRFTPEKCGECEFKDMKAGDRIVMEYLDGKKDFMDATIHNNDINWSAVLACAAIFFILTAICAICAAYFVYKVVKKGKKIAKKVNKKIEKHEKKQAEADAAAAAAAQPAPVAYADPNYGQPYPAQGYPAQQPYPAQGYPAQQPYPAQGYPAQQPYPGQM